MIYIYPYLPNNFSLGLALQRVSSQQNHIGFVFFDSNNQLSICHLSSHKDLRMHAFNDPTFAVSEIQLNQYALDHLATTIEIIGMQNSGSIPYSATSPVVVFNGQHIYVGNRKGEGLTCATFVISVFDLNGFKIADKATWQTTSADKAWYQKIIQYFIHVVGIGRNDPQHIIAMQAGLSKITRYRPEQVFGCGIVEKKWWPMHFSDAEILADTVINIMQAKGL